MTLGTLAGPQHLAQQVRFCRFALALCRCSGVWAAPSEAGALWAGAQLAWGPFLPLGEMLGSHPNAAEPHVGPSWSAGLWDCPWLPESTSWWAEGMLCPQEPRSHTGGAGGCPVAPAGSPHC